MPTLNDFFTTPTEPAHPRVRAWRKLLSTAKMSATLDIFQPKDAFSRPRPELYVQFHNNGTQGQLEELPWEDELNAGLIELGVRAISPEKEAERFALGLYAAMRSVVREFGDGYFSAVLVELIRESDLASHPEIAEVMKHAHATTPHRQGDAFDRYTVCHELIADAIGGRARELTENLRYSQQEATQILVSALARYLDERFAVSRRREAGLL